MTRYSSNERAINPKRGVPFLAHLALGEYYLAHNAHTQALFPLLRAAELSKMSAPQAMSKGVGRKYTSSTNLPSRIALSLGKGLKLAGRSAESYQALEDGVRAAEGGIAENSELFYQFAISLIERNEAQKAIPVLEGILEFQPDNYPVFLELSQAYIDSPDQPAGALQALALLKMVIDNSREPSERFRAEAILAKG